MQIILTYGCNNSVMSYNETSATVTINGESVVFNFTDGQLVPVTSAWQQGSTPMFFYRTVNDGSNDETIVCDPDGKLYVSDNDSYIKRVNDGFAWSTGAASQALITAAGGKVALDEALGDDNITTVISMDGYTVVFGEDGHVTVGSISDWIEWLITNPPTLFYIDTTGEVDSHVMVNSEGKAAINSEGEIVGIEYYDEIQTDILILENKEAIIQARGGSFNVKEIMLDNARNLFVNGNFGFISYKGEATNSPLLTAYE